VRLFWIECWALLDRMPGSFARSQGSLEWVFWIPCKAFWNGSFGYDVGLCGIESGALSDKKQGSFV